MHLVCYWHFLVWLIPLDELIERHQNDFETQVNPAGPPSLQPGELAEGGHAASGCAVGLELVWPFLPVQCGACRVGIRRAAPHQPPARATFKRQHTWWWSTYLPTCQLVPGSPVSGDSPSDFAALVNPLTVWSGGTRWWNSAYIHDLSSCGNWSDLGELGLSTRDLHLTDDKTLGCPLLMVEEVWQDDRGSPHQQEAESGADGSPDSSEQHDQGSHRTITGTGVSP